MDLSRRELASMAAALAASGQQKSGSADATVLEGKMYDVSTLPEHASANGASKSRAIFNGFTTRGQHLTMHATELAPGQRPHPAASQPHEEIFIVQQGTIECTLNDQTATLGPGAVLYSAYNDLKDWKNVGTGPAIYYVVSLEDHK